MEPEELYSWKPFKGTSPQRISFVAFPSQEASSSGRLGVHTWQTSRQENRPSSAQKEENRAPFRQQRGNRQADAKKRWSFQKRMGRISSSSLLPLIPRSNDKWVADYDRCYRILNYPAEQVFGHNTSQRPRTSSKATLHTKYTATRSIHGDNGSAEHLST